MKYLILFFISSSAFACHDSVSKSDFDLVSAMTPPPAGVAHNCKSNCVCLDGSGPLDTNTAQFMSVNNGNAVVDNVKKAAYDAQIQSNQDDEQAKIDASKQALVDEITAKVQASLPVVKGP